jgi:hypothetical protein
MIANRHVLMLKYENVIEEITKERKIPLRSAFDIFYRSRTYKEMRQGIADMHCRSDIYLAEEINRE